MGEGFAGWTVGGLMAGGVVAGCGSRWMGYLVGGALEGW